MAALAFAQGPTVTGDTYLQSGTNASQNFGALATVVVGPGTGATQNRGLVKFDLSGLSGVSASDVQKAVIWVYVNRVTTAGSIDVYDVTSSWAETTATWNSPPTAGAIQGTIPVTSAGQWVGLDITTEVQTWLTTPALNNGVMFQAFTAPTTAITLDSKESTATSHPAQLQIVLHGPAGATGPAGAAGATGATGVAGAAGATGPAGDTGPTGATGVAGPSGPSGPAGVAGPSGPSGPAGVAGPSGPSGPAGAAGPSGPSGPAGVAGPSGPSGPAGAQGNTGAAGPTGATGAAGPASLFLGNTVNPTALNFYIPVTGAPNVGGGGFTSYALAMAPVPVACTLKELWVTLTGTTGSGGTTQSITVYKNGASTSITCSLTTPASGSTLSCNDTAHSVSLAAGDTIALFGSQSSATPVYRIGTGLRCDH